MRLVIIGGGPAGMLAAIGASKTALLYDKSNNNLPNILIIEKNEKLGKKMFITGKGRCNLTNNCIKEDFVKNIVRNSKFIYSSYTDFSNTDFINLVEENGCPLKVERGNRVFPISDKSYDVIDALKKQLKKNKVKVKLNTEVVDIKNINESNNNLDNHGIFEITTNNKEKIIADKVIIATGGLSYKSTGSTGDGYRFAKKMNINVINQSPSLVPFNVLEVDDCKSMQGLTLKNVSIDIKNQANKSIYKDFGEMLFTHFGVSGPIIISASSYVDLKFDEDNITNSYNESNLRLSIDLKPALNEKQLEDRLLRELDTNKTKLFKNILSSILPSSMIDVFLKRLSLIFNNYDLNKITCSEINKEIRKKIIFLLKSFDFTLTSKRGFSEAIITRGGIDVKEINPKTMESKKIKGLYFAGEVIDIDALTGGFNIQLAATTGYVAGERVINDI
ncbi:MAG: NAD(P)/FAD-dependent oxidoreductase [Lachnospiraceae bacterium]|nr:NAD(P)/FAD-dependent oxidoreductase [Lachnospiraceae bacterium]